MTSWTRCVVARVGGADEEVVGDVDARQQRLEALGVAVGELLRRDALALGRLRDRLAVLVGAGEEEHLLAALAHVPGEDVGADRRVRVAEVRRRVDVVDRGGDVEGHGAASKASRSPHVDRQAGCGRPRDSRAGDVGVAPCARHTGGVKAPRDSTTPAELHSRALPSRSSTPRPAPQAEPRGTASASARRRRAGSMREAAPSAAPRAAPGWPRRPGARSGGRADAGAASAAARAATRRARAARGARPSGGGRDGARKRSGST